MGIRANNVLEIIHTDVSEFKLADNTKAYLYVITDNFSRQILHLSVHSKKLALYTFEALKAVHEKFLKTSISTDCLLMTDDGSENFGEVKRLINESSEPQIKHIIAQTDIQYSNSMAEAAIKQLKYSYLYHLQIPNFSTLEKYVQEYIQVENNRPKNVLNGLTSNEVFQGMKPSSLNISPEIQRAKTVRIIENKKAKCCNYSF